MSFHDRDEESYGDEDTVYVVAVDSRTRSTSDPNGYHERSCSQEYFDEHVVNRKNIVCAVCQVAIVCGLNIKIYYHEHSMSHVKTVFTNMGVIPVARENRAASLLTFNPQTGHTEHTIRGKAYVVLNNGKSPLSKKQVWGIEELIRSAKDLYMFDPEHRLHAKQELLKWCLQYRKGHWGPDCIYESRKIYQRNLSNISDQATYHHGYPQPDAFNEDIEYVEESNNHNSHRHRHHNRRH